MHKPSVLHFGAAKRVLRYIARTTDYGLWYGRNNNNVLEGYTDSDWATSCEDRKSLPANVFSFGSTVVTWSTKKQRVVALSTGIHCC